MNLSGKKLTKLTIGSSHTAGAGVGSFLRGHATLKVSLLGRNSLQALEPDKLPDMNAPRHWLRRIARDSVRCTVHIEGIAPWVVEMQGAVPPCRDVARRIWELLTG